MVIFSYFCENIITMPTYYPKLNKEKHLQICKLYSSGELTGEIAKKFDISSASVYHILHYNKIPIVKNRRYTSFDETYFEKIDTSDKAYFLGLLYADGNICLQTNQMRINLQERDVDIIEKFKSSIQYTGKIGTWVKKPPRQNQKVLAIRSKKLITDLIALGCLPNKTHSIQYPKIDASLEIHFIRGFFDGDGTINIPGPEGTKKGRAVGFSIIGLKPMCIGIANFFSKMLNKEIKIYECAENKYQMKGLCNVFIGGKKDIKYVMDTWYQNTNTYLQRKYDKYYEAFYIKELAESNLGRPVIKYDWAGNIIDKSKSITEAAKKWGMHPANLRAQCIKCSKSKIIEYTKADYSSGIWCYEDNIDDKIPTIKYKPPAESKTKKAITQYSLTNELVAEWDSITEAAKSLNIRISGLAKSCKKQESTYKGYKWVCK